jgi:hypothetical protein
VRGSRGLAAAGLVCLVAVTGCGGKAKSSGPTTAPTVSLWTNAPSSDFRQVNGGAKLALADAGGHAGVFRVNFAAREIGDDPSRAVADTLAAARMTLQDTQSSAMLTGVADGPARAAITLLNEAGIGTVTLGDAALKADACSARSDIYPNGRATAIVVDPTARVPADWSARFERLVGVAPTAQAYRAYLGVQAILKALAAPGVATDDDPQRLDRDALAAALVREARGACAA